MKNTQFRNSDGNFIKDDHNIDMIYSKFLFQKMAKYKNFRKL